VASAWTMHRKGESIESGCYLGCCTTQKERQKCVHVKRRGKLQENGPVHFAGLSCSHTGSSPTSWSLDDFIVVAVVLSFSCQLGLT
jgi:hypothetical protein